LGAWPLGTERRKLGLEGRPLGASLIKFGVEAIHESPQGVGRKNIFGLRTMNSELTTKGVKKCLVWVCRKF
jgi:hypothetical protein